MLRHFAKLLELFPFSKLAKRGPIVRVYAIEHAEPPLVEKEFPSGVGPNPMVEAAREFTHDDCAVEVAAFWDLWQYDGEWKLTPTAVTLACFGPSFDNDASDHLRVEFGLDASFLPQPHLEGPARMVQSNVRSMLHLVNEIDRAFELENRQLWSESGVNFAEVLASAVRVPSGNGPS